MQIGIGIGTSFAGTGPWQPTNLSGCVLWLRADMGITLNGSDVSGWADQSAKGNDAAQGTAADQPEYLSGGWSSGLPTVSFVSASTEAMSIAGFTEDSANDYSVFAALDLKSTGANQYILSDAAGPGVEANNATTPAPAVYDGTAHRDAGTSSTGEQILSFVIDSSGPDIEIFRNGSSLGTDTYDAAMSFATGTTQLGRYGAGAIQYLDAELAELIVYDRVLTAAELAVVHAALQARYGL